MLRGLKWAWVILIGCTLFAVGKVNRCSRISPRKLTLKCENIVQEPEKSNCYVYRFDPNLIPKLRESEKVYVVEDQDRLGFPDTPIEQIASQGFGRYLISPGVVYFSTPDNSDPRTNERIYRLAYWGVQDEARLVMWRRILFAVGLAAIGATILLCIYFGYRFLRSHVNNRLLRTQAIFNSGNAALQYLKAEGSILLLLAVPPLAFVVLSPNLFFDPPGSLDPFVYVTYFLHYHEHLFLFDKYYKVSRLPWILPGLALFKSAGAIYGTYLLQTITLFLGNVFLYQAMRATLKDKTVALSVALLYASCTQTHGPGGWNYHMTIANAYYFMTSWCLSKAFESPFRTRWLMAAGVGIAAGVHTSLFQAIFLPLQFLHYASLTLGNKCTWSWKNAALVFAGGLALTGLLGAFSFTTGGEFFFFMSQIRYTLWLSKHGNHWFTPAEQWLGHAYWLAFPIVILIGSFLALGVSARRRRNRTPESIAAASLMIQFVIAAALMSYSDFVSHQTVLHPNYMAAAIYGPAFLATGAILYTFNARVTHPSIELVGSVVLAFTLVPLIAGALVEVVNRIQSIGAEDVFLNRWPLVTVVSVGLCAIAWQSVAGRFRWTHVLTLALLCVVGSIGSDLRSYQPAAVNGYRKELFEAYIKTEKHLAALDPTLLQIKFWFDENEEVTIENVKIPMGGAFNSCLSCRGWLGNLLGASPVPKILELQEKHITGANMIGILAIESHADRQLSSMQKRLSELGRMSKVIDNTIIASDPIRYRVIVMEVVLAPGASGRRPSPVNNEKTSYPSGNPPEEQHERPGDVVE